MKKWLIGFVGLLISVSAVFVLAGLLLPSNYTVERSRVIDAPPEAIHQLINDLHQWPQWQPWTDGDPSIQITLGELTRGKGASQSWRGNSGTGELLFTRDDPTRGIDYDIVFDNGSWFCKAFIHHSPVAGGTRVNWQMSGEINMLVLGPYFALFMDDMAGPMFERGLEKLAIAAENSQEP